MGQAWCKEKSGKAQDSKSPLDRVFLRCAHRIYPGLKEEGLVLGGATQKVTSSEIGYASSPSREVLARGQSIDSVDRPFHPNDWVDVNLEVPGTPRGASSIMTNLTLDTTLYPPSILTSTNSSGSRDFTPVAPPRRRNKNRGRPLPPKPTEVPRSDVDPVMTNNCLEESKNSSCHEPLYSSVKSSHKKEGEIFEHKVNGNGRIIPNIVLAGYKSNDDKYSRDEVDRITYRPKNSSTVSLPNYSELEVPNVAPLCEEEGDLVIHKITAAESLPSLIINGTLENVTESDEKNEGHTIDNGNNENGTTQSVDEVDLSFNGINNANTINSAVKIEGPILTSTPVKNDSKDDSKSSMPSITSDGSSPLQDSIPKSEDIEKMTTNSEEKYDSGKSQFLDWTNTSRGDIFFEAEEDQLHEYEDNLTRVERSVKLESEKHRTRTILERTLSSESEPFDSYEEKKLTDSVDLTVGGLRSNSQVKLLDRSISDESLPREMLDHSEETDFFGDDKHRPTKENTSVKLEVIEESSSVNDTKTPPPSPEPKIKPEIFDNDHSTLLKVLRDEAEGSNLSSMTPSLTELEAALSDMLEREDDHETDIKLEITDEKISTENIEVAKSHESPIEPLIDADKNIKKSVLPVCLKNILGASEQSSFLENSVKNIEQDTMVEIELTNGDKYFETTPHQLVEIALNCSPRDTTPIALEPPEKPSRLHRISLDELKGNSGSIPTPPRRRNRSSVSRENSRRSSERTTTPDNPYPNDRLI